MMRDIGTVGNLEHRLFPDESVSLGYFVFVYHRLSPVCHRLSGMRLPPRFEL